MQVVRPLLQPANKIDDITSNSALLLRSFRFLQSVDGALHVSNPSFKLLLLDDGASLVEQGHELRGEFNY